MDTETPGTLRITSKYGQWAAVGHWPVYNINNKRTKLDSWQIGIARIAALPAVRLKFVSVQW